jgi:hypothetical protein
MRAGLAQATVRALHRDGLATQAFSRSLQTKGASVYQPTGSMLDNQWTTVKDTRGSLMLGEELLPLTVPEVRRLLWRLL